MIGSGRGGGGGFGSFPYRSSHQQGTDGNNRGRGRGRRSNKSHRSSNRGRGANNPNFQSELDVPVDQRRILVGKNAATLNWLKEVSGANVFVPQQRCWRQRGSGSDHNESDGASALQQQQQDHPVRVNTSDLSSLLHAFHEIAHLLSKSNDFNQDSIDCIVKMKSNNTETKMINGKLFLPKENASELIDYGYCLFRGTVDQLQSQFQVYTIETRYDVDNISTIVDNVKFVQSSLADCTWFCRDAPVRNNSLAEGAAMRQSTRLVFVYGYQDTNPALFYEVVRQAMLPTE
jgi:hypothetical protein